MHALILTGRISLQLETFYIQFVSGSNVNMLQASLNAISTTDFWGGNTTS